MTKGISYSDLWRGKETGSGSRHRFRVRDPLTHRYESECFASYETGLAWAKKRRREFTERRASAASALWSDLGAEYIASLMMVTTNPDKSRHIAQVRQVVDGLHKAGARSITDRGFHLIAQKWVGSLKAKRAWAKKAAAASPSTKAKFLIIARAICGQAMRRGLIHFNPLGQVKTPKQTKGFRPVFRVPALRFLLAPKSTTTDRRWRRFAMVLVYTGLRASEARAVRRSMFDFASGYAEIPANHPGNKSGVARRFPIQEELRAEIGAEEDYLVDERIRRMSEANVGNGLKDYCRRCGVTALGPHAMRHTAASLLTATGLSPHLVMDYIGHETASVTKHYSRNADLHRAYVSGWPIGQFRLLSDLAH